MAFVVCERAALPLLVRKGSAFPRSFYISKRELSPKHVERRAICAYPSPGIVDTVSHPGGMTACSRWLSVFCDTTGKRPATFLHPGRGASERPCYNSRPNRWHPSRVHSGHTLTGGIAKDAQPPATSCHPSGIGPHLPHTQAGQVRLSRLRKCRTGFNPFAPAGSNSTSPRGPHSSAGWTG